MFGIGVPELVLILIVGLIVFGPSKLPEVGRAVGKGIREFRKASNALTAAIEEESKPTATPHPVAADEKKDAYHAPTQEEVRAQLETSVTLTKTVG